MNNWRVEYQNSSGDPQITPQNINNVLLRNRGIKNKNEIKEFLDPDLSKVTPQKVGINIKNLRKSVGRIKQAIENKEKIIIYGDYDVDGVCASAIIWETLSSIGAQVLPFIPSRFEQGYGLSKEGIDAILQKQDISLIITVDNGIVANDAVAYAQKNGVDVIVTDHHTPSADLPKAFSIVHTTKLCGAGVAYLLAREFKISNSTFKTEQDDHLSLVALATVADLVPLVGANRTLLYFGLKTLQRTRRPGLLALFAKAGMDKQEIGVYEIGHIIAPRLNATGRLDDATDSLRLICTKSRERADKLATLLSDTNTARQQLTLEALDYAKEKVDKKTLGKLIFISSDGFNQGIVGLVAGRLVEEYYLPSIVISKGKKYSKASARSVKGFNITQFLRTASDLMVDIGGHPMAAGFTVETEKLNELEKKLFEVAEKMITKDQLVRSLRIDLELPEELITSGTYDLTQKLAPFGMGNPEPTFLTKNLTVENLRTVGSDGEHLKLGFRSQHSDLRFEGIYFKGGQYSKVKTGDKVDAVYVLDEHIWNGYKNLQLKVKDLKRI